MTTTGSACSSDIPVIIGASEDENGLACPLEDSLTWETLPAKIVEEGLRGPFSRAKISREKAERLVSVFQGENRKNDSAFRTFIKMGSLYGVLLTGAYAHAMEHASRPEFTSPVYHYMNAYDSARPDDIRFSFAFHTCDLPLQMRIVQRDQDDWISRIMAHAWAAFARTGDPSTAEYPWPAFTPEQRKTMVFDNDGRTRVEEDPYRVFREALQE